MGLFDEALGALNSGSGANPNSMMGAVMSMIQNQAGWPGWTGREVPERRAGRGGAVVDWYGTEPARVRRSDPASARERHRQRTRCQGRYRSDTGGLWLVGTAAATGGQAHSRRPNSGRRFVVAGSRQAQGQAVRLRFRTSALAAGGEAKACGR